MSNYSNSLQTVGKGKYRCWVTYILEDANTTLYSLQVEVKEKSAPSYIPPVYSYYTITLPEVEGARLDKTGSHTVEEGYSFPFRLTLDADYNRSQPVVSVDRHGTETLTPEVLADGSLKYRIRDVEQDLMVSITGIVRNDDPTVAGSVHDAETGRAVHRSPRRRVVQGGGLMGERHVPRSRVKRGDKGRVAISMKDCGYLGLLLYLCVQYVFTN